MHGRRTGLVDHDARRRIGNTHGVAQRYPGAYGCRQGRRRRVACAGDIENAAPFGANVHRFAIALDKGHAGAAAGHEYGGNVCGL